MKHLFVIPLLLTAACAPDHHHHQADTRVPRPVSIQVEVYDPTTNFVWENVSVRIVEADQEWSDTTYTNPLVEWFLTDRDGLVFFDEFLLAASEVGFVEDVSGAALIGPRSFEDEATVVIEIDAVGFTPVFVEVPISWEQADVFVSVPFH